MEDVEGRWRAWLDSHAGAPPLDEGLHRVAEDEGSVAPFSETAAALAAVAAGIRRDPDPVEQVARILAHVFGDLGFRGDEATYDDPDNSRIDRVLARRRGLPILLSAVTIEVARRVDLPLGGISFPGHFLVSTLREPRVFLDPFHGGRILRTSELTRELRARFREATDADLDRALRPTPTADLLLRVSTNLMWSWLRRRELGRALRNADRRVALRPDLAEPLRDRGLLRAEVGHATEAAFDLGSYLERSPAAPDAARIRWRLSVLLSGDAGGRN